MAAKLKFFHLDPSHLEDRAAELFELREAFDQLLGVADKLTRKSRYQSLGLTALEDAKVYFEQAIVTDSVGTFK